VITYTIKYSANGGIGEPPNQEKNHDVPLTLSGAVPTRPCYTFVIWNTSANGNGTSYAPGANYTTNASAALYAQWKANTYTVKYDANSVSDVQMPAEQEKNCGAALTLNSTTPAKTGIGYKFVVWNTAANGSGTPYAPGDKYIKDTSSTLYAQWICKTDNGPSVNYDNEIYKSVVICGQTWMTRNLNYSADSSECYDFKKSNCAIYGRLYSWATAMALPSSCNSSSCASQVGRGICPPGWHIPSDVEWSKLVSNVERSQGCTDCAGKHLKATSRWDDCSPSSSGMGLKSCLDSYGFSALPGGGIAGLFDFVGKTVGKNGNWWSATEHNDSKASVHHAQNNHDYFNKGLDGDGDRKVNLFSVRCIKD